MENLSEARKRRSSKTFDPSFNDVFNIGFIENIDKDPRNLYGDTDSSYGAEKLPFPKYENFHRTVDYIQKIAKASNQKYRNLFNGVIARRANIDPKYNFMDFKSEVVAGRGFFLAKKFYALGKIWDEGTFFQELKLKKTGGQILKADSSLITVELLSELYQTIVLNRNITSKAQMKFYIFKEMREKYTAKLAKSINNFKLPDFIIPKKWPHSERKTIPTHVKGAMLFNTLFQDKIRPGESLSMLQIRVNPALLYKHIDKLYKKSSPSIYQLPLDLVNDKINVISFPSDWKIEREEEIENIQKLFKELGIDINYDKIIDFNIDMKLEPFKKLFKGI